MKNITHGRRALSLGAAAALLAGCGGSQPPIGAPGAVPQSRAIATHAERGGSWMLPEAKGEDLLYISNYSNVLVFAYPQGKLVGTLKGFYSAVGECVDSKGDVFIANFKPVTVYEYAHGGTKRIGSFPTKKAGTTGCAVNPVNGDLAITGLTSYVEIYRGAKGKPVILHDKQMFFGQFCTYDPSGDLFFAGYRRYPFDHYQLSELRGGTKTFINIKPDVRFEGEVSIQWNDKMLTAMTFVPWPTGTATIVRYAISGNRATEVGETPLNAPKRIVVQYAIDGSTVVLPNDDSSDRSVLFYKYPDGGKPFRILTKKVTVPRGVVISVARSR
jgi:hypothetical protein